MFRDRRKKKKEEKDDEGKEWNDNNENPDDDPVTGNIGFEFDPNNPDLKSIEDQLNNMLNGMGMGGMNFPFAEVMKDIMKKMNVDPKMFMKNQGQMNPEQMNEMLRKVMEQQGGKNIGNPFVFGFNMNIGPDGKFRVNPVGNVKTKNKTQPNNEENEVEIKESRDPVIDVFEENENVIVIAEMPGVTKEEINMEIDGTSLILSAKNEETFRNYYSKVELPKAVYTEDAKARFTNGILELKMKKK
jgi:HSP20 family protein